MEMEFKKRRSARNGRRRRQLRQRRMRRTILVVLLVGLVVVTVSRATRPPEAEGDAESTGRVKMEVSHLKPVEGTEPAAEIEESEDQMKDEEIVVALPESGCNRDDVPLSYELQGFLHTACEEAGVPYALALAVIEKETDFRNMMGDDGASEGYTVEWIRKPDGRRDDDARKVSVLQDAGWAAKRSCFSEYA